MTDLTLPIPSTPQMMEALLELEAGGPGPATRGLAKAALHAGLPRPALSKYLVEVVRAARELRTHLRTLPPDFSLVVAILTPDQALAYLYEVEEDLAGPVGVIMKKHWSGLDATDRAYLVSSTLDAARALREQWQSQIGTIRWDLTAVYA